VLASSFLEKEGAGCCVSNMSALLILRLEWHWSNHAVEYSDNFYDDGCRLCDILHTFFPLVFLKSTEDDKEFS